MIPYTNEPKIIIDFIAERFLLQFFLLDEKETIILTQKNLISIEEIDPWKYKFHNLNRKK